VSNPVLANQNVFIIEQTAFTPADTAQWNLQRDAQRQQVGAVMQQDRIAMWLDGLRETANIIDRRAEVLQPADEDASPFGSSGLSY
jgi:hypothetical protein